MTKMTPEKKPVNALATTTAHVLAHIVKEERPGVQLVGSEVHNEQFSYDFESKTPFSIQDLQLFEEKMKQWLTETRPIQKIELSWQQAQDLFHAREEEEQLARLHSLDAHARCPIYVCGNAAELSSAEHLEDTNAVQHFKLLKVSAVQSETEHRQRLSGVVFWQEKELDDYLIQLAEAEKRDHRKIGKQLGWFHWQDDTPGMVFWHPDGFQLFQVVKQCIRQAVNQNGYREISTPIVLSQSLWEKSGHWDKFKQNMFVIQSKGQDFAVKPMNCPGHVQIFNENLYSYRDLPLRFAEFGCCHRNELSGALHGLMRLRQFTQDDAHIFCTDAQIGAEATAFIEILRRVYADFGFAVSQVKLSTRPEARVGEEHLWDKAESMLSTVLDQSGLSWELQPGEGAFYGPKIEFSLSDSLGRVWQCGTLQLDFSMPERLGARYVSESGEKLTPVMLHRAILGSVERFIAILIEEYAGFLPFWLAPCQVMVIPISEKSTSYAQEISSFLHEAGIRARVNAKNDTLNAKIREATTQKMPLLLIVGEQERDSRTVSIRTHQGQQRSGLSWPQLTEYLLRLNQLRGRTASHITLEG